MKTSYKILFALAAFTVGFLITPAFFWIGGYDRFFERCVDTAVLTLLSTLLGLAIACMVMADLEGRND